MVKESLVIDGFDDISVWYLVAGELVLNLECKA